MDIRKIAEKTRKLNNFRYKSAVIMLLFASNTVLSQSGSNTSEFFKTAAESAVMILIMSLLFIESFFTINSKRKEINTADLAQIHRLDYHKYFTYIAKRLIPALAVMIAAAAIRCFFTDVSSRSVLYFFIFTALITVIPYGILFIRKKLFEYECCRAPKLSYVIISHIIKIVITICSVFWLTGFFSVWILLAFGIDSTSLTGKLGDVIAYHRNYVSFILPVLVCLLIFGISIIASSVFPSKKAANAICVFSLGALIILAAANAFISHNYYVLTTESSITVCEKGFKTEYSFEDVEKFDFYYNQDYNGLGLSVKMKDGTETELFGELSVESEKYSKSFDGIFNFGSYLADKMISSGADGEIRDINELKNITEGYEYDIKGLNEIIEYTES